MPVDMQDPPELIPEFVRHWEAGHEIVYGIRDRREENFLLASARKAYYALLSRLTYVDYPPNVGDFQLVDRCVLDAMKQIDDAQPFMRLMTFECGFRSIGVKYTWRARKHGVSRNPFSSLLQQILIEPNISKMSQNLPYKMTRWYPLAHIFPWCIFPLLLQASLSIYHFHLQKR